MRLGKHRGRYCVIWTDEAGRHRQSLGTSNREDAEARFAAWRAGEKAQSAGTVGQIVLEYIADREPEIQSADRMRYAWNRLAPTFENIYPAHIDNELCRTYAESRNVSDATTRYELGLISQAMLWAKRRGIMETAPHVWRPGVPPPRDKRLTKKEFAKFLAAAERDHARLFGIIAATTGARSGAILELKWESVDLDKRLIDFGAGSGNKRRAVVPINDKLLEALRPARKDAVTPYVIEWAGGPIKSVKKAFQRMSRRSGIHCTPHMIRHSAAVWMAEEGVPMSEISQFLGHTDSRTTERVYARYSPHYLRGAAKALDW